MILTRFSNFKSPSGVVHHVSHLPDWKTPEHLASCGAIVKDDWEQHPRQDVSCESCKMTRAYRIGGKHT